MTRPWVLLVEDDDDLRELEAQVIEDAGWRVWRAREGGEALRILDRHGAPGVILLDMRMPGMDGWAFSRALHRRFGNTIPLVVVSAAEDARRWAKEVDADAVIAKPFDLDHMLRTLATFAPLEQPAAP